MKRRLPRNQSVAVQHARVVRELDLVMQGDAKANNFIEEQLRQCPEAFEVGKIVEMLFDNLKNEHPGGVRLLPPAGVIMPPIV
jgi:hypothetical protein